MAAKKTKAGGKAKSTPKKKATAAKKSAPKSKGAKQTKKAASKKSGAKKAAVKKKAAPKKKAAVDKAAAPKKAAAAKKKPAATKAQGGGSISSTDINLGHVFALRPRANTSFRPNDFMAAKRALVDERYDSIPEAARAVAEEALSLTRGEKTKIDSHPRR
jgi:hypothetical protein